MEDLEARTLLSAVSWDGGADTSNWFDVQNWDTDALPGPEDDVSITSGAPGAANISISSGTASINSLDSGTSLTILSGTLSIATTSEIAGNLILSGGTLSGAGTLTVSGLTTWTGGTMSGAGVTNANGGLILGKTSSDGTFNLDARTFNNNADATLTSKSNLAGYGLRLSSGATFNNNAGATFDFLTDTHVRSSGSAGGTFVNAGTLSKSGGAGTSTIEATLNNTGTVQVDSGTLNLEGTFSSFSKASRTLTGGSYVVSATLKFVDADIVTNMAEISLIGESAAILDDDDHDALRNLASNTVGASLTIQDGKVVTTPGAFDNSGSVTVGAASTLTATGAYTQDQGSTNLVDGGVLTSTVVTVAVNGGLLGGDGTVNANVANHAEVVPGGPGSAGVLSIAGNYTQDSDAGLTVNLGRPNPDTGYSQLTVTGQADLAGTLSVVLIDGFAPGDGATFQVVNYNPHAGEFDNLIPVGFPVGTSLSADYTPGSLVLMTEVAPVLTSIMVVPANPSLAKGLTEQLTAIGTYSDDSTANLTNQVVWTSTDAGVATISNTPGAQGLASGLSQGNSLITAALGSLSGSTSLTITAAALQSIAVTPIDPTVAKGLTQQFSATGNYSDGATADLTNQVEWTSSDTSAATVDSHGLALGLGVGASVITASLGGITSPGETLTVTPPETVNVTGVGIEWGSESSSLQPVSDGIRWLPAGRTNDIPWSNINQVELTLTGIADLRAADVAVSGILGGDYGPVTITGSGTDHVVITLARTINLADRVTVTIGNARINTFHARLDVLPGDFNDDRVVNSLDLVAVRNGLLGILDHALDVWADVNGDGKVDVNDYITLRKFVGKRF